jgi:hypothetical protein
MARRKETTIEPIYREVTGNRMPAEVKNAFFYPSEKSNGINRILNWSQYCPYALTTGSMSAIACLRHLRDVQLR